MALNAEEEASIRAALNTLPAARVEAVIAMMNAGLGPNETEDDHVEAAETLYPLLRAMDVFATAAIDKEKLRATKAETALAKALLERDAVAQAFDNLKIERDDLIKILERVNARLDTIRAALEAE